MKIPSVVVHMNVHRRTALSPDAQLIAVNISFTATVQIEWDFAVVADHLLVAEHLESVAESIAPQARIDIMD